MRIGIDIVHVPRVRRALDRWGQRFVERFLTEREAELLGGDPRRIAGNIAAKEALRKALGAGLGRLPWRAVEVLRDSSGAPYYSSPPIQATLSITHDGDYAVAVCLLTRSPGSNPEAAS